MDLFDYKIYSKTSDYMEKELIGGMIGISHIKKRYLIDIQKKQNLFCFEIEKITIENIKDKKNVITYLFDEIFEMIEDVDLFNRIDEKQTENVKIFFNAMSSRIADYEELYEENIKEHIVLRQFLIFYYIYGLIYDPYKIIDVVKLLYDKNYDYDLLARVYLGTSIKRKKDLVMELKNNGFDYKNMIVMEHVHLNKDDWKEIEGEDYNSDNDES